MGSVGDWAEAAELGWSARIAVIGERPETLRLLVNGFKGAVWHSATEVPEGCESDLLVAVIGTRLGSADIPRLRRQWRTPVAVASCAASDAEEVACLAAGADAYLDLNHSTAKLMMRMRALIRRHRAGMGLDLSRGNVMRRGALWLDVERREVRWRGQPVRLSETEICLLSELAARPGFVKSRGQLMDAVRGDDLDMADRTVDSHIKRLRKKLRHADPEFSAIRTLYGVGYSFALPPE